MENYKDVSKLEKHIISSCCKNTFSKYGLEVLHNFCTEVVGEIDNFNALNCGRFEYFDEEEYSVESLIEDEYSLGLCVYDDYITYENCGEEIVAIMNYGDDCIDVVMNEWSFTDDFYREETLENLAKMIIWKVED